MYSAKWHEEPSDTEIERYKRMAAEAAVEEVISGMVVGLGHGSTTMYALLRLADLLHAGTLTDIRVVPCSQAVADAARAHKLPLVDLDTLSRIDLTIDGADEITPQCQLLKGGGGALLREKIVAQVSHREIIVVDQSKLSRRLGTHADLPVEVLPFGWHSQHRYITGLGATVTCRRQHGAPWITEQGNYILDCHFGAIEDPATLAEALQARAGILAHGIFIGLMDEIIIAGQDGLRHLTSTCRGSRR